MPSLLPPLHDGHAPIYLQHAFADAVHAYENWDTGSDEPAVAINGKNARISVVFRRLWNCTDIVPRHTIEAVRDVVPDSFSSRQHHAPHVTFAEAAGLMRDIVKSRKSRRALLVAAL